MIKSSYFHSFSVSFAFLKSIFVLTSTFFFLQTNAQSTSKLAFDCGLNEALKKAQQRDPDFFQKQMDFDQRIYNFIKKKKAQSGNQERGAAPPYTLPVVVHIIHNGGAENISDGQVLQAIDNLNAAFSASGYYAQQGATADMQIQFCLAKRDPDGNATTGITRDLSPLTDMIIETDDINLKNINRWNPNDYINIWVVKEIARQGGNTSVVGYAYYPSSHGGDEDGLVCEAKYFGTTPAEDAIFIHELGHYLGLKHTFEGGCMNGNCLVDGDNVCDTPPDQSRHTDCNFNSCSTDAGGGSPFVTDVDDMTENFMDYSPFACYFAFTPGQADRMQASIEVERASLLASLGCVNPCPQPITAVFSPASGAFSAGETVTFTNTSIGATDYTWYVNGVAQATTANFTFMFPDVGSYTITLEVGNTNPDCIDVAAVKFETICPVVADLTASDVEIEVGESVTFTSTSTNATTDDWYINNALVGTGSPFIYTFSTAGNYIVRLVSGNGFCEDAKIIFAKVNTPCTSSIDDTQFLYNVGENFYPYCITSTSDGGLLSYGQYITSSNTVGTIVKTAANGDLLWVNSYAGVNQMMKMAESIADNSYVLIANHETTKMPFLMKVSAATGAVIWKTDLTDLGFESFSYDLVILPNNDIFTIMGSRRVVRFSSAGAVQWSKELDGSGLTKFFSVTQRPDGALLIAGSIWEGATRESAVIFMDENGNVLDIKYYGVLGTNSILFNDIAVAADNSYTVHGSFRIPGGGFTDYHKLVFQCDATGNVLWAKDIDFPSGPTHSANKNYIVNTSDDGYVLFGSTNAGTGTSRHFMKVDGSGNLLWTRAFDLPSATMRLVNLSGNNTLGCYIAMSGDDQLFITKIDGNGSAGGCNESDHMHPIVDIPLSYRSDPLPFLDIILNTASVIPSISTLSFPKISLCTQPSPCPEICDNGLDDDGDGYVDCFDSDCDCGNDCMLLPEPTPIAPHLAWETTDEAACSILPPIVANMNPQTDTISEIIALKPDGASIHGVNVYKSLEIVFYKGDGSNKSAPSVLQFSASQAATSQPAVGDLDKDGIPELIVLCLDGRLRIYRNFDPNAPQAMELWLASQNTISDVLSRPSLADFNHDGIPEIYVGNNIFVLDLAHQTLRKVLTGQGPTGNIVDYANFYRLTASIAGDLLSEADCGGDPDCNGLELAAGHVIYSIDLDPTDGAQN